MFLISRHFEHVIFGAAVLSKLSATVALFVTVSAVVSGQASRQMSPNFAGTRHDATLNGLGMLPL